ncbi:hypothetical protein DLEV_127 [Diachasmimorpha longicaudata entomopoxvirus]|uniref:Uncharacterized protein n=1 Tax=Diachasmimorpha longicaudata entomopoxvirus TaxID=109981 RepID=A0A7R5WS37_9POXV|nr:hypothetical protein QKK69_gp127 [Diachasmimorpha longicaudata entomopoxvirus]AKS26418.1 hypothetical protein DLEV_127 [Diachasmimorpha longicaudata entomopoxvirus]
MENQIYICVKGPEGTGFQPLFSVPISSCAAFGGSLFQTPEISPSIQKESRIQNDMANFSQETELNRRVTIKEPEATDFSNHMLTKFKKFKTNKRF